MVLRRCGEHFELQTLPRPEDMRGAKADQDRQAHRGEEEGQRRRPHPVHLVMGAQVGDADDDGRKDQWHEHHAQQVKEEVANQLGAVERARGNGCRLGAGQPQAAGDAGKAADQDLRVERSKARHAIGLSIRDDDELYPVIAAGAAPR